MRTATPERGRRTDQPREQDDFENGAIDVADLARHPLAIFARESQASRQLDEVCRKRRVTLRVIYEDDHADALVLLAERGVAVAVPPSDAVSPAARARSSVAEVHDGKRPLGGQLSLMWRDEATLSTSARRFHDIILARASRAREKPLNP